MTADLRAALGELERLIEAARQRGQAGVVARQQLAEFTASGQAWLQTHAEANPGNNTRR